MSMNKNVIHVFQQKRKTRIHKNMTTDRQKPRDAQVPSHATRILHEKGRNIKGRAMSKTYITNWNS